MRNAYRRAAILTGATGAVLAMTAGSALAHDCYIANRSAQGTSASGTHSQSWVAVDVSADFFQSLVDADGDGLIELGEWTQAQADCMTEEAAALGAPMEFSLKIKGANGQDGVLASSNPHPEKSSDGQGVDHFFMGYFPQLAEAGAICGAPLPE